MVEHWYSFSEEEVAAVFQSDIVKGLSEKEVRERLVRFGPNRLTRNVRLPWWGIFSGRIRNLMVMLLLAATVISFILGEYLDALAIAGIMVLSVILGFIREYRAGRLLEALKQFTVPEARVIREGLERKVPAEELVPGDIILLETGDIIPADVRLLKADHLETEESAITGVSLPARKETGVIKEAVGLAGARNIAYLGTAVTRGRGRGIVVATGMAAEMGRIAGMIRKTEKIQTALQWKLARLGKSLAALCLGVCALIIALGIYRGGAVYQMFLSGLSLAAAAIPEGLPAIVTAALAVGAQRLARRRAIIRRPAAVESLGCVSVICSGKTGVLTQNRMVVRRIMTGNVTAGVTGEGYDPKGEFTGAEADHQGLRLLLKIAALCNNAVLTRGEISISGLFRGILKGRRNTRWDINGDPTEGALLVMAAKGGVWREEIERKQQRLVEFPFDSGRKRMTVVYRLAPGELQAYVKGAPDVILELCTHYYYDGRVLKLTADRKEEILRHNAGLAAQSLRVLAMACRELPSVTGSLDEGSVEKELTFVGLAGMLDPLRPEALPAIQECRRAGIRVVMITGDQQLTAGAVAGALGLLRQGERILTGPDLDGMDDHQLQAEVRNVSVFACLSLRHKLRIVRALKRNKQVVALTGKGIDDVPAVTEADLGIALGITGAGVTREAAEMVLADDNFSAIVGAVAEGRGIYDNVRKITRYLLSCSAGKVLTILLAILAGMPLPLLPVQILWMILAADGLPPIALGVDPPGRDIMRRRPGSPQESIFARGLGWRILAGGLLISAGALFLFNLTYRGNPYNLDEARTMVFNALVFFQLFYALICRLEHLSLLELGVFSNPLLLLTVACSGALQAAVTHVPLLQVIFHTVPLDFQQWALIGGVTAAPLGLGILYRRLQLLAGEKFVYLKA